MVWENLCTIRQEKVDGRTGTLFVFYVVVVVGRYANIVFLEQEIWDIMFEV